MTHHPSEVFELAFAFIPWWMYILLASALILGIITPKEKRK